MRCMRCTRAKTSARSFVRHRVIARTRHLRARRRKRRRTKSQRLTRSRTKRPTKKLRRRRQKPEGGPKEGSDHFRRIREEALVARSRWLGRLHQQAHAESVGRRVDQAVRKAERECDRGFGRVVRAASFRGLFLAFREETACSWRCPVATLPHSFALEQFTGTGVNDLLRCVQLTFYRHRHAFTLATSFLSLFYPPFLARHLLVSESFERQWKIYFLKDKNVIYSYVK